MKKPNFIIAGVARCGTTSLFHYLKQHPQIDFPTVKEPKYFSSINLKLPHQGPGDHTVDDKIIKTREKYYELFKELDNQKMIGEASSDYFFYHQHSVDEIKKELGDIKIILCFRSPIERSYSAYTNLIRDSRETLEFEKAIEIENERMHANYDWMWAYKQGSLYSEGLKTFQDNFKQVKVIFTEELEKNPAKILQEVFEFLGVNSNHEIDTTTKYSHSGKPKSKIIAKLNNRNNKFFFAFREIVLKLIPRTISEKIASKLFKKDPISDKSKATLRKYFKDDIFQLEKLMNKDLSHWK